MLLEQQKVLMARSDARRLEAKEQEDLDAECLAFMDSDVRAAAFTNTVPEEGTEYDGGTEYVENLLPSFLPSSASY